jgi:hypothetical protein
LEVGKCEAERVGVRVKSRIIERPVEENVRLREERVATPFSKQPCLLIDLLYEEGQGHSSNTASTLF